MSKWIRNSKLEAKRLASPDPSRPWGGLAGLDAVTPPPSRTRQNPRKQHFFGDSPPDQQYDGDYEYESETDLSESNVDIEEWNDVKPPASRFIVEGSALETLLSGRMKCESCDGVLELKFETVTLATSFYLKCNKCTFIEEGKSPAPANFPQFEDKRERNTDYAINVLFVLGIICNGSGSVEAGRLLGLLGLPNDTTMETRSFATIEERIAPHIWQLYQEILAENLESEVKATVSAEKFNLWKQSLDTNVDYQLPKDEYPKVSGSFDCGWNQRSRLYNSPSGHAFLVGKETRKPIQGEIKSKLCSFCTAYKKRAGTENVEIPEHYCLKNYEGSSGGMEAQSAVDIVVRLHNAFQVDVDWICMDDDSSTRAALQWSNEDYKRNNHTDQVPLVPISKGKNKGKMKERDDKGLLPGNVPIPKDTADPNHRRKLWTGDLLTLADKNAKDKLTMTKMNVQRLGKNMGYMIKSLQTLPEDKWHSSGMAVLEHHFDNHVFCGPWCRRKHLSILQRQSSDRYYRNKEKDAALYEELNRLIQRFISVDKLKEVAHGMDTNVNESINNTISYFAPKN
jgi:hypothetical protein